MESLINLLFIYISPLLKTMSIDLDTFPIKLFNLVIINTLSLMNPRNANSIYANILNKNQNIKIMNAFVVKLLNIPSISLSKING